MLFILYYFKIYCEEKPITDGINIWKNVLFAVDKMHVQGRRKALILDAVGDTKSKVHLKYLLRSKWLNWKIEFLSKRGGHNSPCPHTSLRPWNWKIALLFVLQGCHDDVKRNFIYFTFLSNLPIHPINWIFICPTISK